MTLILKTFSLELLFLKNKYMKKTFRPLISVCIPVYETEVYLESCLKSVIIQDFDSFEIVIVSDASSGKDLKGRSCKKIVKAIQKECKKMRQANGLETVPFVFQEHRQNRGLVEARRSLVNAARGNYILMLDSDDELFPGALSVMYAASEGEKYDILQAGFSAGVYDDKGVFQVSENRFKGERISGPLYGYDIFHKWLVDLKVSGLIWGKLIRRSVFCRVFENIPYTECTMAEDFLIFFFLSLTAESYFCIEYKAYRYRLLSGITSSKKIDSLKAWEKICSTANVFTIIALWLDQHKKEVPVTAEDMMVLKKRSPVYLLNNIKVLKEIVVPELKEQAEKMLCEYWGEDFVKAGLAQYKTEP